MLSRDAVFIMNDVILNIYETNHVKEMREMFLAKIKKLIPYKCAMFDLAKTGATEYSSFFDPVTVNMSDQSVESYFRYYQKIDYTSWIFSQSSSGVYKDTDLIAKSMRERTEIFIDWMKPMGLYYGSGSSIIKNGVLYGSVTLFRSKEASDFSDDELFVLEMLNQHLSNKLHQLFPYGIKNEICSNREEHLFSHYGLTSREREVVRFIMQGQGNKEIAQNLYIAETTVKKHISHIFEKTEIKSRIQLIKIFMQD